jgi:hypothetical protein
MRSPRCETTMAVGQPCLISFWKLYEPHDAVLDGAWRVKCAATGFDEPFLQFGWNPGFLLPRPLLVVANEETCRPSRPHEAATGSSHLVRRYTSSLN